MSKPKREVCAVVAVDDVAVARSPGVLNAMRGCLLETLQAAAARKGRVVAFPSLVTNERASPTRAARIITRDVAKKLFARDPDGVFRRLRQSLGEPVQFVGLDALTSDEVGK